MLATVCVGNTTFLGISNAFVVKVLPGVVWIVSRAPLIHDMGKVVSAAGLQRGSAHGSEEDPTFFTVGATTRPATGVLLTLVSTEEVLLLVISLAKRNGRHFLICVIEESNEIIFTEEVSVLLERFLTVVTDVSTVLDATVESSECALSEDVPMFLQAISAICIGCSFVMRGTNESTLVVVAE